MPSKPQLLRSCALGVVFSMSIGASSTNSYSYDALGRLVQATVTNPSAPSISTAIQYDAAGNRTTLTVSGAPSPAPTGPIAISISNDPGAQSPEVFAVTASAAAASAFTVDYRTEDGSGRLNAGHAGTDYVAQSGTLTFAPGQTSKEITVVTMTNGTFSVVLTNPTGGTTIQTSAATGGGGIISP